MSEIASSKDNTLHSSKGKRKSWPKPQFLHSKSNGKIRKTLKKEDQCTTIKDQQRLARKRFTSRTYWRKKRAEEHEIVSQLTMEQSHLRKLNDSLASKNQALRDCIAQIRSLKAHHQQFHLLKQVSSPHQQSRCAQNLPLHQPIISHEPPHFQQLLYHRLLKYSIPQQTSFPQFGSIAPMPTAIDQLGVPTCQNASLEREHLDLYRNSSNVVSAAVNSVAQSIVDGASLSNNSIPSISLPFVVPVFGSGLIFNTPSIQIDQIQQPFLTSCTENIANLSTSSPTPSEIVAKLSNYVTMPSTNDDTIS